MHPTFVSRDGEGEGVWKKEDKAFMVLLMDEEKVQWEKRKPHRAPVHLNFYL